MMAAATRGELLRIAVCYFAACIFVRCQTPTRSAQATPSDTTALLPALSVGNIVAVEVQTTSFTTVATAVTFLELTISGVTVKSMAVPSTGASACTLSGSITEGKLRPSADFSSYTMGCYMVAAGSSSLPSSSTLCGAVSLAASPAIVRAPVTSSLFSSRRIFSAAIFDDAANVYMHGAIGSNTLAICNVGSGGTGTTTVYSANGGAKAFYAFVIYAGSLYASTSSLDVVLIGTAGILPLTAASTTMLGTTVGGSSETLSSFVFQNATWLWACTRGTPAGQGVSRYILSADGTFTNPYVSVGTWQWSSDDCLDITGQVEPSGYYYLYWVVPFSTGSAVYRMGATAGAAATALTTSAFQLRGIQVVWAPPALPGPSPSQDASVSQSRTQIQSTSPTGSQSQAQSATSSLTATQTPSVTVSMTTSLSLTGTSSTTPSQQSTQSPSSTLISTNTQVTTTSQTRTLSQSFSASHSQSATQPEASLLTKSASATVTPHQPEIVSNTGTSTATITATFSSTTSVTQTLSVSQSAPLSQSLTPRGTEPPTLTRSASMTGTRTPVPTVTQTVTDTPAPTASSIQVRCCMLISLDLTEGLHSNLLARPL